MSADILITDDRLNFSLSLADFLRVQGQRVIVTSDAERAKDKKQENPIGPVILWNRQSAFSLQSLPLQFKNFYSSLMHRHMPNYIPIPVYCMPTRL